MERRAVAEAAAGKAPPRQLLPPGFRFHPTDEELVVDYLCRKILACPLPAAVIPVVHLAALPNPWDLPGASQGEASYFFSQRQMPGRGGGGPCRRAASGYWKATGKETPLFLQLHGPTGNGKRLLVGVKTSLTFHLAKGKAPATWADDWVMHEYRLAVSPAGDQKQSANDSLSSQWVVCRVSLKNRARRPAAGDAGSDREDDAGDRHQSSLSSPSSSCVTDTCHASDHHGEVSSRAC